MTIQKIFDRKLPQKILLALMLNGIIGYLWPDFKVHNVNVLDENAHQLPADHAPPMLATTVPNVNEEPHDLEKTVTAPLVGIGKAFERYGSMFGFDFDMYALRSGSGGRRRRRNWLKLKRISPATA